MDTGTWCKREGDCVKGTAPTDDAAWMQTTVTGAGMIQFWWMVSSEGNCDLLEFYIDGVRQDYISGDRYGQWEQESCAVGTGTHTLKWRYVKDGSDYQGYDCGRVDWVQWNGTRGELEGTPTHFTFGIGEPSVIESA